MDNCSCAFSSSLSFLEINATGFNYQNEDEKVTLSFPSALHKGKRGLHLAKLLVVPAFEKSYHHCC